MPTPCLRGQQLRQHCVFVVNVCPRSQQLHQLGVSTVNVVNDYADKVSSQPLLGTIFENIKLHFVLLFSLVFQFFQSKIISHVSALTLTTLT